MYIVSASRRTDLIGFFFDVLYGFLEKENALVQGPYGRKYEVNLAPENIHTLVLWSKNFANIVNNRKNIRKLLNKYGQIYLLFTITGLGSTIIEKIIPPPDKILNQIKPLVELFGPERVAIRFDPIVFYKEQGKLKTNFTFFDKLLKYVDDAGIKKIIFSFTQYYPKVKKRFEYTGIEYFDPSTEDKIKYAEQMVEKTKGTNINLYSCSQDFLLEVKGINKSRCIDAEYLSKIHPLKRTIKHMKDKGQRDECGCSVSKDIGSYSQLCPIPCLYCYASTKIKVSV